MAKLLGAFTHHHDSVKVPWRAFVASEADALQQALQGEYQLALRERPEDVLARAKEAGKYGTRALAYDEGYEGESEEDGTWVVVWDFFEEGGRSFGCGPTGTPARAQYPVNDTDKRENVWIHVEEWSPDAAREAELESFSKAELVQRLLEVEALR